jgi:dolichol kinase
MAAVPVTAREDPASGKIPPRSVLEAGERVKSEAPRKLIHLGSIVIPIGILYLPLEVTRLALLLVTVLFLVVDMIRLHDPRVRSYFAKFFGRLIRHHERSDLLAATYQMVSALLATYLFPREIAAASYIYLVVGDGIAALVGKAWGRVRVFDKTLEGCLAGFATSWAAAVLLVRGIPPSDLAIGALVAAVVELLPLPIDDNFRIPLLSGVVLQSLM